MTFESHKELDYTIIKMMCERLEPDVSSELKSELVSIISRCERNIIIDMTGCFYCDAVGLATFLVGYRLCVSNNGIFILMGLDKGVNHLVKVTGLDTIFNIVENIDDAIKLIKEK